ESDDDDDGCGVSSEDEVIPSACTAGRKGSKDVPVLATSSSDKVTSPRRQCESRMSYGRHLSRYASHLVCNKVDILPRCYESVHYLRILSFYNCYRIQADRISFFLFMFLSFYDT